MLPPMSSLESLPPALLLLSGVVLLSAIVQLVRCVDKKTPGRTQLAPMLDPRRLSLPLPHWVPLPSLVGRLVNTVDLLWNAPRLHDWLLDALRRNPGAPFSLGAFGLPHITVLSTPKDVELVLQTHFQDFPKGDFQRAIFQDLFGFGIHAVDGGQWARQRKIAGRVIAPLREAMTTTMRLHTRALLLDLEAKSREGESAFDLFRLLNRFTMEAFVDMGFGLRLRSLDCANTSKEEHPFQRAFDGAHYAIAMRFVQPQWLWRLQRWLNVGSERELRRHLASVDETVFGIIHDTLAKRQNGTAQDESEHKRDIVTLFLDSQQQQDAEDEDVADRDYEEGPKFLRDAVVNFMIAGRDPIAQTLSWLVLCLHQHPSVEAKVREELVRELPPYGSEDEGGAVPTVAQVSKLTYLEAAIRETLRLHPPVPISTKDAARDVVLGENNTLIPEGSTVLLAFYAMARSESVWGADAADFKPERWLYEAGSGKRLRAVSPFQFPVFNAGPRRCLGEGIAMLELKVVAAALLRAFRFQLEHPERVDYEFTLTLPVRDGTLRARALRA